MSVVQMTFFSCPVSPFSLFHWPLGSFSHISAMEPSIFGDLQRQGAQYSPSTTVVSGGGCPEAKQAARRGRGTGEGCGDSGDAGALGEATGDKDREAKGQTVGSDSRLINLGSQCVQDRRTDRRPAAAWSRPRPDPPCGLARGLARAGCPQTPSRAHAWELHSRTRGPRRRREEKWR